jgi:hypothetical protein
VLGGVRDVALIHYPSCTDSLSLMYRLNQKIDRESLKKAQHGKIENVAGSV